MNRILTLSKWGQRFGKQLMKRRKKPLPPKPTRWNIVRGDLVSVIDGPSTGQRGKVLAVLRAQNRIIIDGVNMVRNMHKNSNKIGSN